MTKNGTQHVMCLSLLMSSASAFIIGAPTALSLRSTTAPRMTVSSKYGPSRAPSMSLPASSTANLQSQSARQEFGVEFSDVREAFELEAEGANGFDTSMREGNARKAVGAAASALAPLFVGVASASAKGGAYGIIEGRTASFLHPITMGTLFVVSVRSALLGLQWREQRTMSTRMSALKEQLPLLSSGSRASTPLKRQADGIRSKLEELGEDAAEAAAGLKADLDKLSSSAAKEVESELDAMTTRRKELSSKNVRDRHYDSGAILLGLGTFAAIEGPVNTFLRAEKLFPGPHLYAGAGIVVAWAVAASLVPQMQKGNDTARIAHIGINFGMIALFAWQLSTGFEIAVKVWEFTKWP